MRDAMVKGLTNDGYRVVTAGSGEEALDHLARSRFDAVVLDIMLPGLSGYEVLKRLRRKDVETPVLVVSAKDGDYDVADALELGADDYLVKPYSFVVLAARLAALARRGRTQRSTELVSGDLRLDEGSQLVTLGGAEVALTPREFALLAVLMRAGGRAVSKLDLFERVFDGDPDSPPNVVEVYVGYLRRKLGRDRVVTVRGSGYRLGSA